MDYGPSRAEDRAVEKAADFFKRRAGNARPEDLRAFLAHAPDVPPEPDDEIPDRLRARLKRASARRRSPARVACQNDSLEIPGAQAITPAAEAGTPPAGGVH